MALSSPACFFFSIAHQIGAGDPPLTVMDGGAALEWSPEDGATAAGGDATLAAAVFLTLATVAPKRREE